MAQNQPQYVHYTCPPGSQAQPAPQRQSTPAHSTPQPPLVAVGDWTKNLVELAKTAELKWVFLLEYIHAPHLKPNQETRTHSAAPYRAHPICARVIRAENESHTGC